MFVDTIFENTNQIRMRHRKITEFLDIIDRFENLEGQLLYHAKNEQDRDELQQRFDAYREKIFTCLDAVGPILDELRSEMQSRVFEVVECPSRFDKRKVQIPAEKNREFAQALADALGLANSKEHGRYTKIAKQVGGDYTVFRRWILGESLPNEEKIEILLAQLRKIKVHGKPISEEKINRVYETYTVIKEARTNSGGITSGPPKKVRKAK